MADRASAELACRTPLQSAGHTETPIFRHSIVRRPLSASILIYYNLRP